MMIISISFCICVDPYDEFVVFPEYFVATLPGSAKYIEAIKARFAKMAKPLPANFRRTTLFHVGIRKVLKSTDELQKYLKKNERRRMNKERRQVRFVLMLLSFSVILNRFET